MNQRMARISRKTRETDIRIELNLDGQGRSSIKTGLPFLDHMLELFGKHSLIDLSITAKGDLAVDAHHTVEDIGLVLGSALDQALGHRKGINRYGCSTIPMDDALSRVVLDLGGRPYLVIDMACRKRTSGGFDLSLTKDLLRAFTVQGRLNLHVTQFSGQEAHHAYESVFKALAHALRHACEPDPRRRGIPSSKGRI